MNLVKYHSWYCASPEAAADATRGVRQSAAEFSTWKPCVGTISLAKLLGLCRSLSESGLKSVLESERPMGSAGGAVVGSGVRVTASRGSRAGSEAERRFCAGRL